MPRKVEGWGGGTRGEEKPKFEDSCRKRSIKGTTTLKGGLKQEGGKGKRRERKMAKRWPCKSAENKTDNRKKEQPV